MIAVITWIGGFDILYAIADADFDRGAGLHSIPARFGVPRALVISAVLHGITSGMFIALSVAAHLGAPYLLGIAVVIGLLIWEHTIVTAGRSLAPERRLLQPQRLRLGRLLPGHADRRSGALTRRA